MNRVIQGGGVSRAPRREWPASVIVGSLLLHVPLAYLCNRYPEAGLLHAFGTLAVGLYFAFFRSDPSRVAFVAAYLTACEVMWRSTKAPIPWEFSKYSVALVLFSSLVARGKPFGAVRWPIFFLAFLLPSSWLGRDLETVRFYLSGPLTLVVACLFFSTVRLSEDQIKRVLLAFAAPVVSLASLTLTATLTAEEISFGNRSIFATAAGFGPNQVSSILGLGVLAAVIYLLIEGRTSLRVVAAVLALWFTAQGLLTFSRGGMFTTFGALGVMAYYLIRIKRHRNALVFAALAALVGALLLYPWLDEYTGGAMTSRFTSLDTTKRDVIVYAELVAFLENPILGIGPGQSYRYHARYDQPHGSHTVYSRLLAEHGSLGLASLILLLFASLKFRREAQTVYAKALTLSFLAWSLLFMAHSEMRLAAPAFLFGIAGACTRLGEPARRILYSTGRPQWVWSQQPKYSAASYRGFRTSRM
jgi:O-antigen ligase